MSLFKGASPTRRQLIKACSGLGVAAPAYFRGLTARAAGETAPPVRLIVLARPNGSSQKLGNFRLPTGPTAISNSSALAPLKPFADRLSVVSGLTYTHMPKADFGCHLADPFVLSTRSAEVTTGRWDGSGKSYNHSTGHQTVDRYIARRLPQTRLQSLAIRDARAKESKVRYLSYESGPVAGRPNPTVTSDTPEAVWQSLFGRSDEPDASPESKLKRKRQELAVSHLHSAYEAYKERLAGWERAELENHLAAVDDARKALDSLTSAGPSCEGPARPEGADIRSPAAFDAVADTVVAALSCDVTRVVTFFFSGDTWGMPRDFKGPAIRGGLFDGHSDIGHKGSTSADALEMRRRCVDAWHMERLVSLLKKLDSVEESNGTLLDNSVVVYANRDPDHNGHSIKDLTWLVAGGGGGRLNQGAAHRWASGSEDQQASSARFLATLCHAMGVPPDGFTEAPGLPFLQA